MIRKLLLRGVRQNNLKNVDLEIPLQKATVITGPSGSGKSSLAFETIYAEGQRRYMQSLSTYARQFMQQFQAPEAEEILNIPPTIAIEQINPVRNSRATVGTSTELYDYLRLLFEKVGTQYCNRHGKQKIRLERLTQAEVYERLLREYPKGVVVLAYSLKLPRRVQLAKGLLAELLKNGFTRILLKGEVLSVESALEKKGLGNQQVFVVIDRIRLVKQEKESTVTRFAEALDRAWELGQGCAEVFLEDQRKYKPLRSFYKGLRCPECGEAAMEKTAASFSFNSPLGACSTCNGFGNTLELDPELVVPNGNLSIAQGAVDPFTKPSLSHWQKKLLEACKRGRVDVDLPYKDLSAREKSFVFHGDKKFSGVRGVFKGLEKKKYKMRIRVFISRYVSAQTCAECGGARLNEGALSVLLSEKNIAEICEMTLADCYAFFRSPKLSKNELAIARDVLDQIVRRLSYLITVGLGYISLSRLSRSLSGGEYQRILLATQLSQGLTDTLYVLDEPSIGLHPKDTQQLLKVLANLLSLGNSLVVVEHDPELIEWGEHIVDLGPGSGARGGEVIFSGEREQFFDSGTVTSDAVRSWRTSCRESLLKKKRKGAEGIELRGVRGNNLQGIDVHFPLRALVAVTGVSGSGKSTLVVDTLYQALAKIFHGTSGQIAEFESISGFEHLADVELINQSPIGRSSRSNPITFIKGYDEIRSLFARTREAVARGFGPGYFSFNVKGGRCDACDGEGRVKIDMVFMEDVSIPCEACDEKRFKKEVLAIQYREKNIDDVLHMTVDEAHHFFKDIPSLRMKLAVMREVGLGYIQLGQPGYTLSGGESQRLKIARELTGSGGGLRRSRTLFILDEPTTGLHFQEIELLLSVFRRLIESGHSVLVIEHNLQVICSADYLIDLGPDGGHGGGCVVGVGTPKDLAQKKLPYTGAYLADILDQK